MNIKLKESPKISHSERAPLQELYRGTRNIYLENLPETLTQDDEEYMDSIVNESIMNEQNDKIILELDNELLLDKTSNLRRDSALL